MTSPKARARKQAEAFEAALAKLYLDADAQRRLDQDALEFAQDVALDPEFAEALSRVDRAGLELMAESLRHKRMGAIQRRAPWWLRLLEAARR